MEPELIALATAGATTLVTQMTTDGWAQARSRLGRFFARGNGPDELETVEAELEVSRAELTEAQAAADHEMEAALRGEWLMRIRRVLTSDPQAAGQLRSLVAELRPPEDAGGVHVRDVHNEMSGTVNGGTTLQVGVVGRMSNRDVGRG
ncbi:hypothetical protein [Streptomyces sp. NPDC058657]|uniref:hypothetical protein n=1 Tax=unclassified Streptomyces TaxID=2593676 RepID=UPI00364ECAC7